jgi:hypothetical protein
LSIINIHIFNIRDNSWIGSSETDPPIVLRGTEKYHRKGDVQYLYYPKEPIIPNYIKRIFPGVFPYNQDKISIVKE